MRHATILGAWLLLALSSGCAMFRSGTLPPIGSWPLHSCASPRPSVRMAVRGEVVVNGFDEQELAADGVLQVGSLGVRAYEESKLFHWVKGSVTKDADVYAYVELGDSLHRDDRQVALTLCTLFIYPSVIRKTLTLKTTFKNRSGATLGTLEVSETLVRVVSLLMVPLAPFTVSVTPEQDLVYDLHRATLAEAQRKGILR